MPYCSNCGAKLNDGVKFCSECGVIVIGINTQENNKYEDNKNKRKTVFDGEVHKCPGCGEVLDSFISKCLTCGLEIRSINSNNTVKELSIKLADIEKNRKSSRLPGMLKMYDASSMMSVNEIDEQKINLIKTFPIPNTKEDIFEFCLLAYSNIDSDAYSNHLRYSSKMVSEAWISKLEHVYEKSKLLLKGEDFKKIEEIYLNSKNKVGKTKKQNVLRNILIILCCFGIPLLIILLL